METIDRMNITIISILLSALFLTGSTARGAIDRQIEREQVAMWQEKLNESKQLDDNARIASLWLALRNIGHRTSMQDHDASVDKLYLEIQHEILSIPGHAQYFVDELEKRRSALASENSRNDYNNLRAVYIYDVLVHLQDPETISVLGRYLFDHRDDPPPPSPGSFNDADPIPSSTRLAYEAIMDIGLRNPPVDREIYRGMANNSEAYALSRTQTWFNEVKSGQRAFSFIGQKVEYRFKTDGTWDTLALEDSPDAIHQRSSSPAAQSADRRDRERAVVQGIERNPWRWGIEIVAATVAVLGVIWWWRRSRLKS